MLRGKREGCSEVCLFVPVFGMFEAGFIHIS